MASDIISADERWLPVPGFEGLYEVSDLGRVRSLDRVVPQANRWGGVSHSLRKGRILKPGRHAGGHLFVCLCNETGHHQIFIHRLVLMAFDRLRPDGMECRHLDGDPTNNRFDNLAWGTRLENMADRTALGEHNPPRGVRNSRAILDEEKVRLIRQEYAFGERKSDIARSLGVHRNVVGKVLSGRTWGWLD
jgi:hypothetical protein